MNKKRSLIVISLLIVIIAAIAYVLLRPKAPETSQQQPTPQVTEPANQTPQPTQQPQTAATPGKYIDYSAEAVANATGRKLLFFHAPWCPQCRVLDADIKSHTIPDNTTIFKVDYDSNQQLRQKYGVTIQTTVVEIDQQGNLVKKFVAYDKPELAAVLQGLSQ